MESIREEQLEYIATVDNWAYPWEVRAQVREWYRAQRSWVPPGTSVSVQGYTIEDGGVYVGNALVSDGYGFYEEPGLIDPELPAVDGPVELPRGRRWLMYTCLGPAARALYLKWLAEGRGPGAPTWCLFLYVSSLERRLLFDTQMLSAAREEVPALKAELRRLLGLYSDRHAIAVGIASMLAISRIQHNEADVLDGPPAEYPVRGLYPDQLLGLGTIIGAGRPVPAEWALAYLRAHPETKLGVVGERCRPEFERLFCLRYRQRFGDGRRVKAPSVPPLYISYRPLNPRLKFRWSRHESSIPDIRQLRRFPMHLWELAEEVVKELHPYSRYLAAGGPRDSLSALALLPTDLPVDETLLAVQDIQALFDRELAQSGEDVAVLSTQAVMEFWQPSSAAKALKSKDAERVADLVGRLGYGLVPDRRYEGIDLMKEQQVAVFRSSADHVPFEAVTRLATVYVDLDHQGLGVDGTVPAEEAHLPGEQLASCFGVDGPELLRARAYSTWLVETGRNPAGLKTRLARLDLGQREDAVLYLVSGVSAGGPLTPARVAALEKWMDLLGYGGDLTHRVIHDLAVGAGGGLARIIDADGEAGFSIPPSNKGSGIRLDRRRLDSVQASTEAASELLTQICAEEEPPPPKWLPVSDEPEDVWPTDCLDARHTVLFTQITGRRRWSRAEVEDLCQELDLMTDGAIETLNDATYERCGEPLIEGDEELDINPYAKKAMLRWR